MKLCILAVTRNKSISVKTLHTLLCFNMNAMKNNVPLQLSFVEDDPFLRSDIITKNLKNYDRIILIDYSISMDHKSIEKCFLPFEHGQHCIVFPGVKEGIDWDLFKTKIKNGIDEPIEQMGLNFDTEVSKKLGESLYTVKNTIPSAFVFDCKPVLKNLKDKKSGSVKIPPKKSDMFEKFITSGVKVCAFTGAKLITTYSHECLGNILNMSGVSTNAST